MSNNRDLIFSDKTIDELSREELEQCALHFRAAHIESVVRLANVLRRMSKLEEGYEPKEIERLDAWLKYHPTEEFKGDGSPKRADWRSPEWAEEYLWLIKR